MSVPLTNTKHFRLTMALRKQVQQMEPGDPLPTFKELCSEFDVSQATLERALDRLRSEGLLHRAEGTRRLLVREVCDPARLRVVVIRPDWPSLLYHKMVEAITAASRDNDWAVNHVYFRSMEQLDLRHAIGKNDAAIFVPSSEPWPDHLMQAMRRPSRPVLVLQNPEEGCNRPYVRVNDRRVGELAVEYLARFGHRRIAFLDNQAPTPSVLDRIEGWRSAISRLNLDADGAKLIDCHVKSGDEPIDRAYSRMTEVLSHPIDFTALFCVSDSGAIAAFRALRECGYRVPKDVSVIGYTDDGKISPYLYPPLTAVEIDLSAYAQAVVDCVEQHFDENVTEIEDRVIQPRLVSRSSVGQVAQPVT